MAQKHLLRELNLREVLFGATQRLRYVERFSNCRKVHRENVAEHQYFTALFSLLLAQHCGETVNIGITLTRALIHDVEECFTGDIVRPMKHDSEDLLKMIERVGARMAGEFFKAMTKSEITQKRLFFAWEHSKDHTIEGRIVRFADFLSVLSYVSQEVRNGNKDILENLSQLVRYAEAFQGPDFQFLAPLPYEAFGMAKDLVEVARG